jgi:hypothetical protein
MKKHLGTITIMSDDRHANAVELQKVLTEGSRLIRTRLGLNLSPMCSEKCPGLIILAVEGTLAEINALTRKIDKLHAIKAKSVIITK